MIILVNQQIIDFISDVEEEAYENRDSEIIEVIKKVCSEKVVSNQAEYAEHLEDWWLNHKRYVFLGSKFLSKRFIEILQSLLKPPYESYRIQVVVSEEAIEGEELGSFVIEKEKIVYEDSLEAILNGLI